MQILLKYFLWFLATLAVLIFYFFNTTSGHQTLGFLVEDYLSKKIHNEVKIHSLNLKNYPKIYISLTLNGKSEVILKGEIDNNRIDMDYHLKGDSFRFDEFIIEDPLELEGHLEGAYSQLLIEGKGDIFRGDILFGFIKVPKQIEDLNMILKSVDSQKILTFLKKPTIIQGDADIEASVEIFSQFKKRGQVKINMSKAVIADIDPNLSFSLISKVDFDNKLYRYTAKVDSKLGKINIKDAQYNEETKVTEAKYKLELKDLDYFEKFLKHKYIGPLDTNGTIIYNNGLLIKGETNKFGGKLEYFYEKENIDLTLKEVYLERLLEQFSYPILLRSDVSGTITYNMKDKIVLMDTKLRKTRFIKTNITKLLYDSIGINLLSGTYNESTFKGTFQDNLLSSELKIDDGESHLYLSETKMNSKSNKINSKFEIKMQGEEIHGSIYGELEDPKVSIDMRRLLNYQMNKQMDTWLGIENSEMLKSELTNVKEDVAEKINAIDVQEVTETAESFINSFF